MRISLLRERENFERVFSNSIQDYLEDRFDFSTECRWSGNDTGEYICNDFLNVIFHRSLHTRNLASFTREFRYQPNPVRHLAQIFYVVLACRKGIRRITCRRRLSLSSLPEGSRSWIFIPGNHSIRYIDLDRKRCVVFPKTGFNKKFLQNEIEIRAKYNAPLAPRILDHCPRFNWFEEEIISSLPYNRLSDLKVQKNLFNDCTSALNQLYAATSEQTSFNTYLANLRFEFKRLNDSLADTISLETAKRLYGSQDLIIRQLKRIKPAKVELATTHGDFQPANVLRSGHQSFLIDWEYCSKRSLYYDALTWASNARSVNKFPSSFETLIRSLKAGNNPLRWVNPSLPKPDVAYLWLFLLEDLILKIKEIDSPHIREKELTIGAYSQSLDRACSILSDSL